MLTKSSNYNTIWNNPSHRAEVMLIVGEVDGTRTTYGMDCIQSLSTNFSLFGNEYSIGNINVGFFRATLYGVSPTAIPMLSRVEVWIRMTDGTNYTNWLPKGVFYTMRPFYDPEVDWLQIEGYDLLYKGEAIPYEIGTTIDWWTSETLRSVAERMSTFLDIPLEDSTQVGTDVYPAPPFGYSIREILGDIATVSGGNWMLTYVNSGTETSPVASPKLRLVKVNATGVVADYGRSPQSFDTADPIDEVGYVVIDYGYNSDGVYLSKEAGTQGSGRDLELSVETIPDGTVIQSAATNILAMFQGITYEPYGASGLELDPATEIGDIVTCNSKTAMLGNIDTFFTVAMYANIEAPGLSLNDEIYVSSTQREADRTKRTTLTNSAKIAVNADSINAEVLRATSAEENLNTNIRSTLTQTADEIKATITTIETDLENHAVEQSKYIKYGDGKLEMGTEGSQTKAVLTDTKLGFIDPTGDEKAFIGQDPVDGVYKFFVINGHIVNKLELGDHWDLVSSGSDNENRLTIRWRN